MSLSGNLCRKYYLLIAYANRAALIQHSTILSRTFQIQYSQKRWSGSCLNKQTEKKKTLTKPKHREALQGKGFKTVIVNPYPRLPPDYVPGPQPDLLSKGFGSLSGPKPGGVWFVVIFQLHWANREQLLSSGCHLHLTWHQDVSWSIPNHQELLHWARGACCCLKKKWPPNLPCSVFR